MLLYHHLTGRFHITVLVPTHQFQISAVGDDFSLVGRYAVFASCLSSCPMSTGRGCISRLIPTARKTSQYMQGRTICGTAQWHRSLRAVLASSAYILPTDRHGRQQMLCNHALLTSKKIYRKTPNSSTTYPLHIYVTASTNRYLTSLCQPSRPPPFRLNSFPPPANLVPIFQLALSGTPPIIDAGGYARLGYHRVHNSHDRAGGCWWMRYIHAQGCACCAWARRVQVMGFFRFFPSSRLLLLTYPMHDLIVMHRHRRDADLLPVMSGGFMHIIPVHPPPSRIIQLHTLPQ